MNMIICDKDCRHQCQGWCTLEGAGVLTAFALPECGYFSPDYDGDLYGDLPDFSEVFDGVYYL
jgi:hypothetical protein